MILFNIPMYYRIWQREEESGKKYLPILEGIVDSARPSWICHTLLLFMFCCFHVRAWALSWPGSSRNFQQDTSEVPSLELLEGRLVLDVLLLLVRSLEQMLGHNLETFGPTLKGSFPESQHTSELRDSFVPRHLHDVRPQAEICPLDW